MYSRSCNYSIKTRYEIKEKPVFPRMTEVVLERTFEIEKAQKIVDMR